MTTQQMEYFLALAQKLNFSAVAERFFISQPTLSRQISNMEQELNAQLFIRKNNTVSLTQAGERLYAGLKDIYGDFQDLTRQVEDLGRNRAGELHIGLADEQQISPELLCAIRRLHGLRPQVKITIRRGLYDHLRNGLLDGTLDVINGLDNPEEGFFTNMTVILRTEELPHLAVCRPQAAGLPEQVTRSELEQILQALPPLLLPEGEGFAPPRNDPVGDLERNMGFVHPLRRVSMIKQLTAMPLYISAGLGVTIANRTAVLGADPNIRMIPITDGPAYPKVVVYRSLEENPLMKGFVKLIETAQTDGDQDQIRL